jgi:hypothetical protein
MDLTPLTGGAGVAELALGLLGDRWPVIGREPTPASGAWHPLPRRARTVA